MYVCTCRSLNISTYTWPKALQLCLDTVLLQKKLSDEIVIVVTAAVLKQKQWFVRLPLFNIIFIIK